MQHDATQPEPTPHSLPSAPDPSEVGPGAPGTAFSPEWVEVAKHSERLRAMTALTHASTVVASAGATNRVFGIDDSSREILSGLVSSFVLLRDGGGEAFFGFLKSRPHLEALVEAQHDKVIGAFTDAR